MSMKPHNLSAAIRRNKCKVVYAWVWLTDVDGVYIQVSKSEAYQFCEAAKEDGITEVLAYEKENGKEIYIGDDEEEHDASAEEEEEEGVEGAEEADEEEEEEETEEEDLGEEEEEEEAPPPKTGTVRKPK